MALYKKVKSKPSKQRLAEYVIAARLVQGAQESRVLQEYDTQEIVRRWGLLVTDADKEAD